MWRKAQQCQESKKYSFMPNTSVVVTVTKRIKSSLKWGIEQRLSGSPVAAKERVEKLCDFNKTS